MLCLTKDNGRQIKEPTICLCGKVVYIEVFGLSVKVALAYHNTQKRVTKFGKKWAL